MLNIYQLLTEIQSKRENAALCVITETQGSTPLKAGAKMIVWEDQKIAGTIGGGSLEFRVIENALTVIRNQKASSIKHHLVKDHHMCCGGSVTIYIEPILKLKNLYVFGAGHIAKEIIRYMHPLDFKVHVVDERNNIADNFVDQDTHFVHMNHNSFLPQLDFNPDTYIVICTHLHEYDREILAYCIHKPFAYLGMIGSRRKVAITRARFFNNGIATESDFQKVDMPMGFDIGAISPAEIAISIVAKIVEVKNRKGQKPSEKELPGFNHKFNNHYAQADSIGNGCC